MWLTDPAKIVEVIASEHKVAVEQSVSLQCRAEGDPPPSYRWTPCEPPQSVCQDKVLNISKVLNDGVYVCTVTNVLGSDAGNISVCKLFLISNTFKYMYNKRLSDCSYDFSVINS